MFQGASVAFDLSMEEIWIPYMVGATLVVASPAMIGDAEKLPDILIAAGVTVLDTVPTLLGLLNRDIPCVRLILLGGEALPPPLVSRWSKPGRRLFNTYGPTEATVVATACELRPGEPVTIGRPIPNYSAATWSTRASISCRRASRASFSSAAPASPRAISSARS